MLGSSARRAGILGLCALVGCASPRPIPAEPPRERSEPTEPARAESGVCAGIEAPERLTIDVGAMRSSATGLSIRHEGAAHDSFADGTTALALSLVLWVEGERSETWLPSTLAKSGYVTLLGHCVRVAAGSAARVEVDVAPLPPKTAMREALAPCAIDPTIERLEDYALVADGRRYVVNVTRDPSTGMWVPTPLPQMPYHHASRLSLRGLSGHPALALADAHPRLLIELVSRTVEKVPGRHEWRAEYVARVIDVCAP